MVVDDTRAEVRVKDAAAGFSPPLGLVVAFGVKSLYNGG
jgi:hypothetical protein